MKFFLAPMQGLTGYTAVSYTHLDALKYCGAHSGRGEDKWSKAGLTPATRHGIPYPDEANLVFLCRKMAAVPIEEASFTDKAIMHQWYGDHDMHTMYVGEIIEAVSYTHLQLPLPHSQDL